MWGALRTDTQISCWWIKLASLATTLQPMGITYTCFQDSTRILIQEKERATGVHGITSKPLCLIFPQGDRFRKIAIIRCEMLKKSWEPTKIMAKITAPENLGFITALRCKDSMCRKSPSIFREHHFITSSPAGFNGVDPVASRSSPYQQHRWTNRLPYIFAFMRDLWSNQWRNFLLKHRELAASKKHQLNGSENLKKHNLTRKSVDSSGETDKS